MEKLKTYAVIFTLAIASIIGFSAYTLMDNKTDEVATQEWRRVRNASNQFEWKQGFPSGIPSCLTDQDICHVVLPTGMNPADMTKDEIIENAVDGEYALGYTIEP
ncbi:hypothetical protein [Sphingobacterium paucimobilis]|uniref:Uncharacterized protein n=1 Tax=Sphingobacterium paucimobilis HER1398 TaxID=1346330 RepID=U2HZA0_9SPHI|nr:hypothetical protein [Sphingobacterium paucimobilis]ERJ60887.1 hypothetical protein M472_19210 [Sphingobacterium paucimobilis HER1398]